MEDYEIQSKILENIKELYKDNVHEVLDFKLFLKHRQMKKSVLLNNIPKEKTRKLLLDFGKCLFDGEEVRYSF